VELRPTSLALDADARRACPVHADPRLLNALVEVEKKSQQFIGTRFEQEGGIVAWPLLCDPFAHGCVVDAIGQPVGRFRRQAVDRQADGDGLTIINLRGNADRRNAKVVGR
jgi:hypothetical protein